jgi:hypothetical protein
MAAPFRHVCSFAVGSVPRYIEVSLSFLALHRARSDSLALRSGCSSSFCTVWSDTPASRCFCKPLLTNPKVVMVRLPMEETRNKHRSSPVMSVIPISRASMIRPPVVRCNRQCRSTVCLPTSLSRRLAAPLEMTRMFKPSSQSQRTLQPHSLT